MWSPAAFCTRRCGWLLSLVSRVPTTTCYRLQASCDFTSACQSHSSFPEFECRLFPKWGEKMKCLSCWLVLKKKKICEQHQHHLCPVCCPSAVVGIRLEVLTAVLSAGTGWSQKVSPELIGLSVFMPSSRPGSIGALWWDPVQRLLFSGASDHSIIMWDIGGRKGRTLLLQGHQ